MPASVMVGLPCYGKVEPDCMFSIFNLLLKNPGLIRDIKWRNLLYVDQVRNWIVRETLKDQKASHLLFLDTDMFFSPGTVDRLLGQNRPVVGAQYFRRMPPYETVAGNFHPTDTAILPLSELKPGCYRVDCLGLGCTLIETKVLRDMREHFGDELWFRSEECGEDLWFFKRLKRMEVGVWLDGETIAGHVGQFVITDDHWRAAHQSGEPIAYRPFS